MLDNLKKWGVIALVIVAVLAVIWGFFKPARVIETMKAVLFSGYSKETVDNLKSQVIALSVQKSEVEKKLARASELNKNVNIHREFYPDGKLKSEDIIDLSKYVRNSNSVETATTTTTVTVAAKAEKNETKSEKGETKETYNSKTVTDSLPLFSTGLGFMNSQTMLISQGINIFGHAEIEIIFEKSLIKPEISYGGMFNIKY